jgi:hypothetical protein
MRAVAFSSSSRHCVHSICTLASMRLNAAARLGKSCSNSQLKSSDLKTRRVSDRTIHDQSSSFNQALHTSLMKRARIIARSQRLS